MASEVLSKFSVYSALTAKIVRAMSVVKDTWEMPWHTHAAPLAMPTNAVTEEPYRGVNVLSLWIDALALGYRLPYWASYRQWQRANCQVRVGEHGSMILFYRKLEPSDNQLELREVPRSLARAYWVFNAAQVDGYTPPPQPIREPVQLDERLDAFVRATRAHIEHGYERACYRSDLDLIEMPEQARFIGSKTSTPTHSYYATVLHELTHWTGAGHRLDRAFGKRFGDHAYAFEELVAELGAAFLCSAFGLANEPRHDHAAYLSSWLTVLKEDQRAIFTASSKAQEAIEYLSNIAARMVDPLQKAS